MTALRLLLLLALLATVTACDETSAPTTPLLIVAPSDAPDLEALDDAVEVLAGTLETMTAATPEVARVPASEDLAALIATRRPKVLIVLDADTFTAPPWTLPALDPADALDPDQPQYDDRFVLYTANRATGLDVALASRTRLGRQYAVYELLRRVGARYYHPEDEFLPEVGLERLPERLSTPTVLGPGPVYGPAFVHRSYSFHGAHPLEQLESFSDARHPIDEARNVNDWIIKNRGDLFRGAGRGVAPEHERARRVAELDALRLRRGLRRTVGITLHNQQQGASADLDPTSHVPLETQARELAIARAQSADAYGFSIHFGPTELTTTPDRETVALINAAGQAVLEVRPDLIVEVNDHTTGTQPVDHYDDLGCPPGTNSRGVVDYYDLVFHTDPRFSARVHTVMFHPLEGPAPVYNQKTFSHKLCLMQRASEEGRPLIYYPESAYWLSWDNTIPVYLPLYLHSRWRDMQLIRPLLLDRGGSLRDHRLFNSGHEWGYWQADYAVGLLHWTPDLSLRQVVGELADPLCPLESFDPSAAEPISCHARTTFIDVLIEVMESQRLHFLDMPDARGRPGGLYTMFAGEDPADELGAASGLEFRPVRVPFREVVDMSATAWTAFRADLERLEALAADYEGWRDRLQSVRAEVPAAGLPYLDETLDGLAINALRARHTHALYQVAAALREHGVDAPEVTQPWAESAAYLAAAKEVIRRREAAYRYPAAQTIGGGVTPDTAVDNGTTYPFRVHTRTHLLSYWQNRQAQVEDLVNGRTDDPNRLNITPVFAPAGTLADLSWPALEGLTGELSFTSADTQAAASVGDLTLPLGEGIYRISGLLETAGAPLPVAGAVVRGGLQGRAAPGAFHLEEPDSPLARTVLAALVPLIRLGLDGDTLALAAEPGGANTAAFSEVLLAAASRDGEAFATRAFDFGLPIPDPSTGRTALTIGLHGATLSGPVAALEAGGDLLLEGRLSVDDLVTALVELAGFEPVGAIETLAGILGFDPSAPPSDVPFSATLTVNAETTP